MPEKPYDVSDAFRAPSRKTVVVVVAVVLAVVALGVALHVGSERAVTPKVAHVSPAPTWLTGGVDRQTAIDAARDQFTYALKVTNGVGRPLTVVSVAPVPAEQMTVVTQAVLPVTGADFAHPPAIGPNGAAVAAGESVWVFVRVHVDCAQPVRTALLGLSVRMRDGTVPVSQYLATTGGGATFDPGVTGLPTQACA